MLRGKSPANKLASPPSSSSESLTGGQLDHLVDRSTFDERFDALERKLLERMDVMEKKIDGNLGAILAHLRSHPVEQSDTTVSTPKVGAPERSLISNPTAEATTTPEKSDIGKSSSPQDVEAAAGDSMYDTDDDDGTDGASSIAASYFQAGGYDDDEEPEKKITIANDSSEGMINPKGGFRMSWDLGVLLPFLVYLTIVMPFRLTFVNEAVQFSGIYWFEFLIDMVFIADIALNFRTGFFVEGVDGHAKDEILVEYDRKRVAWSYASTWFVLDVVSGVPFSLIELILSSNTSGTDSLKSIKSLKLLRFLKLGRLLKIEKILSNLDRDTLDRIEDFLNNGSTQSTVTMVRLLLVMSFACHLMACGWVLAGRSGLQADEDSWLNHEM